MTRKLLIPTMLLVALSATGLLLTVYAGSTTPLSVYIYNLVVDEHDTTAYYNSGYFCSGYSYPVQASLVTGDTQWLGPSSAYDFGSPWWTPVTGLASTAYVDKADCGSNCLRVQFNSNNKILSLDTRGTAGPTGERTLTFSFAEPCGLAQGCQGPAGDPTVFGGSETTPVLMNVFLDSPYSRMEACTSKACPEAEPAFAKVWFADPAGQPDVTWRIDWHYLRVLRISPTTWYIVADACDGSQIAGLSKLIGSRTRPKTVFNGYYKIPFFIAAVQ